MDEPKKQQTRGLRRVEAGEGQYQSKHRTNTNPKSVERAKVQKTEQQNSLKTQMELQRATQRTDKQRRAHNKKRNETQVKLIRAGQNKDRK